MMMGSVCECCLASYCSCRRGRSQSSVAEEPPQGPKSQLLGFHKQWEIWKSSERSCVVHSRCSFCNGALSIAGGGTSERSVKRKLAKVYAQVDGEEEEQRQDLALKGDESSEGKVRENQAKKQKDMNVTEKQSDGGGSDTGDVKWLMEALEAERQTVNALYLELEEERHAAAVAATESLAMITRLQEEKAAVQMEASQYRRMVEEKSIYEEEVFGILNHILATQEEENLALAKEVETYRSSVSAADKKRSRSVEVGRPTENGAFKGSDDDHMTTIENPIKGGGNKFQARNLMDAFTAHRSPGRKSAAKSFYTSTRGRGYSPARGVEDDEDDEEGEATSSRRDDDEKYWKKYGHAASRDLRRASNRLDAGSSSDGYSRSAFEDEVQINIRRQEQLLELNRRLQALEADRGYLKQSYGAPRDDEMDILEQISQQLRHFQAMDRKADEVKDLSEASFVFSFKGFFSFNGLRKSLYSNLNRLACMFIKHTEGGGHEHHVGLSYLLENSRNSSRIVPFITRGIKADNPPMLPSSYAVHRQSVQWPTDARGRSDTAFNGWDY